jgi:dTDP-glucose pyrophosphorylase
MEGSKIKEITIYSNATIHEALTQMDSCGRKLLIVFDKDEGFSGIISIGDIQRAIINNIPMTEKVNGILRKHIQVAYDNESLVQVHKKMLEERIECMPVLNIKGNLINVVFWEDISEKEEKRIERHLNIPVVVMAGGEGIRMRPITNVLPKPLIPLGDKTIIEHIMEQFSAIGCNSFLLSVNYKAEMIKYFLGDNNFNKYKISYFQEDKPLGTAGSLSLIKDIIHSTFFLSNCDILIDQELGAIYDFHVENKNKITLVAALKTIRLPYGTLRTKEDGLLIRLVEKPDYTFKINSGLYILEPEVINEIPENQIFHITDLIEKLIIKKERIGVFPVSEGSWKDIGNWDDYLRNIKIK